MTPEDSEVTTTTRDESLDLVLRGGRVVTPDATSDTDIGITAGRIAQLGGSMRGAEEIDVGGKLVLPGGLDMHVHLSVMEGYAFADDFESGSYAAAAGGVTTVGDMTWPKGGESLLAAIDRVAREEASKSIVDYVLHPILRDPCPERLAEIPQLADRGHTSLKLYMVEAGFDKNAADYLTAMELAGQNGILTLVHCEDDCVISHVVRKLVDAGNGDLSHYEESRPIVSERIAVARAIAYAQAVSAPIYIVHLSSEDALNEARRARASGSPVYVETRPIYLHFTRDAYQTDDGPLYVSAPPVRRQEDVDALWAALDCGDVHTYCTDHAPWMLDDKLDPDSTVASFRPGMSDLETLMPLLFSEGVRPGRLTIERFVQLTSTNAAKLFGLFPQKGTITVGADADLVVWDPELKKTFHRGDGYSRAGWSLYEGREIVGWPARTIARGETIYLDGKIVAKPGRGRLVYRGPTRKL
jgi:dihydropyrimidinase